MKTGECQRTLVGHTSIVRSVKVADNVIVSGSEDKTLRLWDLQTGAFLWLLVSLPAPVTCTCTRTCTCPCLCK
jgi:WD40 repeat protein